ncbi:MAG: hypothetical protein AB2814_04625 [Candidatus Sedimenticola endophacoides]
MAVARQQGATELMRKLVPINTLSDASLEKLMPHVKFSTLKKGGVLFKQGDNENYSR